MFINQSISVLQNQNIHIYILKKVKAKFIACFFADF